MFIRTRRVLAFQACLPQSFSSVLFLSACLLIVTWMCWPDGTQAQDASATPAQAVTVLETGKPVERELAGGQSHSYQIVPEAGQYLRVVVEQRGIDVIVSLFGPDGKKVFDVDSPNGDHGPENLATVVESAGSFRLDVSALNTEAKAGRYEVSLAELRTANRRDRLIVKADQLDRRSSGLQNENKSGAAIELAEEAIRIREEVFGDESLEVASSLLELSFLYYDQYNYQTSIQRLERALAIREKILGSEHPSVAHVLNNLGANHFNSNDFDRAEKAHHRALAIGEKALGPDHPTIAPTLLNLGLLYQTKGDYAQAESLLQRALTIWQKEQGAEAPDVGLALFNLGHLYQNQGDYVRAEPFLQRALLIFEKAFGSDSFLSAVQGTRTDLAGLYCTKGDYDRAEPLLQRVMEHFEKTATPEGHVLSTALQHLATLNYFRGNYNLAEQYLQRALSIREKVYAPKHPDIAALFNKLAAIYCAGGNISLSVVAKRRAVEISEYNLSRNLLSGSEHQKRSYLALFANETNEIISLHVRDAPDNNQALRLAFTTLLQRKGSILNTMTDTVGILRRRANSEDLTLLNRLALVRSQMATLFLHGPNMKRGEIYLDRLTQLGQEIETLEVDLSRRSLEFRTTTLPVTTEAVTAAIPGNTALVEFVQYRPVEAKTAKQLAPHYVVYVLTAQGEPRWAELGAAAAIDQQVEALRLALRNPKRSDYQRLARRMDKQVMEPVRKLIGDKTQLLLSPDGMLNLLPFAALVDESGKYLMERYKLTYLSSGRDLLRLQIKQNAGTEAFVLANPDFEQSVASATTLAANTTSANRDIVKQYGSSGSKLSESVSMEQVSFKPLPGTASEAIALRALLPEAKVLTGGAATEGTLKQLHRPHLLHIATHGYFLKDLVLPQTMQSDANAPRLPDKTVEGEKIENPLLRSGLALAGANRRKSGEEDGILTALEAAGLDLWGTKLVVLSACDTGVGEVKNGEGVYGLRRAFVLAGSESHVMSLWSVSDTGAKELMVEYYKRLMKGEGRGEALRQVQLQMLKTPNRRHPYYWASFIQSGEWANLEGKR